MKFRSLLLAALVCLAATSTASSLPDVIEQRYATRWDAAPIARFSMQRNVTANAARCRIDEGRYEGRWINGRATGIILGQTTWRIPVDDLAPGVYNVTYDLRTPTGAEWIPGTLRVPQIARHTGRVGQELTAPERWPQDKYERVECDSGLVEFAWDRENLYIRPAAGAASRLSLEIDTLPAVAGADVRRISVNGATTVTWRDLFPATPLTGQVLRYRAAGAKEWVDLLFVGTGEEQYFGATTVSNGPGGDDQGPPAPILEALVDLSGLNCRSTGVHWGAVERRDPGNGESVYDWSGMLADADLYKRGMTYCGIDLGNPWADELKEMDPERYWKLADRFAYEAAKRYGAIGIRYFSLSYNEPECFFRTDKEDFFNENLTHLANAVHRAVPDAQVIAGKFSSGDPGLIKQFYAHGFKDNFDVLDIHPYNNDPLTGCAMGEVVASHEALDELGMGHKRIFLGEGWGPTRDLKQVVRTKWDEPVSPEEADVTRQFYQNGYRCMVTAREDFCPDWVVGAKYFTLNDNVGGTYWKQAARPVKNSKGEVLYYMIGELRFGDPAAFRAFFCNGGLIDFQGNPKGQWFYDFPPVLPEVRVIAAGGPDYVLQGEWHTIDMAVVNANPRPISNLTLGLRSRTGKFKGSVSAEAQGEYAKASLAPGGVWTSKIKVRLDSGDPGRLRLAVELQYDYDGERHISDDIISTQIREPIAVRMDPPRVVLEGSRPAQVGVKVQNNQRSAVKCKTVRQETGGVAVEPSAASLDVASGKDSSFTLTVTRLNAEPGLVEVAPVDASGSRLLVAVPLSCARLGKAVRIDGDLADWPRESFARDAIRFGSTVGKGDRPADDPFPEPPPVQGSALDKGAAETGGGEKPEIPAFGANAAAAWDNDAFYVAVMVEDATFRQEYSGLEVWRQDSVQLAFDPANDGPAAIGPSGQMADAYGSDDLEMALAQTIDGPQVVVVRGPAGVETGVSDQATLAVRRDGRFSIYEARIPWQVLRGVEANPGSRFGLDILVNNFEGSDRYTLGWAGGIGHGKFPGRFVPVVLR